MVPVVATKIFVPHCLTFLERREPPPCRGPSSVRLRCTLSRKYSSRKLGGGRQAVEDHRDKDQSVTEERTFFVYDPSIFLRYEDARRAVHGMLASMPLLKGIDLSMDNCLSHLSLEGIPSAMLRFVRRDDDDGLTGGHYHFYVVVRMEINLVYSEPKAVVRACAEAVMQTVDRGSEEQCSICMEAFEKSPAGAGASAAMSPVNLPCSHPFHTRCITVWLFKGHTCPVCRADMRGLVSAPWPSQAHEHGEKN